MEIVRLTFKEDNESIIFKTSGTYREIENRFKIGKRIDVGIISENFRTIIKLEFIKCHKNKIFFIESNGYLLDEILKEIYDDKRPTQWSNVHRSCRREDLQLSNGTWLMTLEIKEREKEEIHVALCDN